MPHPLAIYPRFRKFPSSPSSVPRTGSSSIPPVSSGTQTNPIIPTNYTARINKQTENFPSSLPSSLFISISLINTPASEHIGRLSVSGRQKPSMKDAEDMRTSLASTRQQAWFRKPHSIHCLLHSKLSVWHSICCCQLRDFRRTGCPKRRVKWAKRRISRPLSS